MSRWSPAFTIVFTMGIVNLFGDVTYEGGASINGPFMATLGASAAAVSIAGGGRGIFRIRASSVCWIHRRQERSVLARYVRRLCNQSRCYASHGAGRKLANCCDLDRRRMGWTCDP